MESKKLLSLAISLIVILIILLFFFAGGLERKNRILTYPLEVSI